MKKIFIYILSLTLLLSAVGCTKKDSGDSEVQEKFAAITDQWFLEDIASDIITYHYGVYDPSSYDIEKPEVTLGTLEYEIEDDEEDTTYKDRLAALEEIDVTKLTEEQQISYKTYVSYFTLMQEMQDFQWDYGFCFTPSSGVNNNLITNFTEYELRNEEDAQDLITLVKDTGRYIDEAIAYTQAQAEDGIIQNDNTIDEIITQIDSFTSKVEDNEIIKVFTTAIEKLQLENQQQYIDEMSEAVTTIMIPAYQRIKAALTDLKGKATNTGGLSNYEHGKEYYQLLMRYYAATDTSVDDLEEQIYDIYYDTLLTLVQTDLTVSQEKRVYSPDYGMTDPSEMIEHIKSQMSEDFPEIQEVEYSINTLDPTVVADSTVAYCLLSPIDHLSYNIIKVNPSYSTDDPAYLAITLSHEGYPGHLYQHVYYFSNHSTQKERTNTEYLGFTEGWAMYVMQYGYKYFDDDETVYTVAAANNAFNYYLAALCDILVNYEGYDVEDLTNFMEKFFVEDYAALYAESFYDTAVSEPFLYISYGIGLMEMQNLYSKAESSAKNFNVKEFNTLVLDCGCTTFDIIEEKVDEYIKTNK